MPSTDSSMRRTKVAESLCCFCILVPEAVHQTHVSCMRKLQLMAFFVCLLGLAVRRMAGVISHDLESAGRLHEAGIMLATTRHPVPGVDSWASLLCILCSGLQQPPWEKQSHGVDVAAGSLRYHIGAAFIQEQLCQCFLLGLCLPGLLQLKTAGSKSLQTSCKRVVSLQAGCRCLFLPAGWWQHSGISKS